MTDKEKRKALAEIKRVVRATMRDVTKQAMKSLDKLQFDGVDIAEDHIADGSSYRIPKDFLTALFRDCASSRGYGPVRPVPRNQAKRIDLYFRHL